MNVKSRKNIIIVFAALVLVCAAVVLIVFLNNNKLGPSAKQSVKLRVMSISDSEFVCVNDEEIEGDKDLGFNSFDKGAEVIVKPYDTSSDFSDMHYQNGDIIEFTVLGYDNNDGRITVTTDKSDIHKVKN